MGVVRLDGKAPPAESYEVDKEMLSVCRHPAHKREPWLLDANGGLADCVITLYPTKSENLPPMTPLSHAIFQKDGCNYSPHVLVVPQGTIVTFQNLNSPCNGFNFEAIRGRPESLFIRKGEQRRYAFQQATAAKVSCDVRGYMEGYIVAVDTPYFALTKSDGSFEISNVVSGEYELRIWHEKRATLDPPRRLRVRSGVREKLDLQVRSDP